MLILIGRAELWELLVLQLVYGAGEAVFTPASRALSATVVPREQLQQANALLSASRNTNAVLGPVLGGALVAALQPGSALAVDAASFAVAALMLTGLSRGNASMGANAAAERERLGSAIVSGWRIVRSQGWLWPSIAGDAVLQFAVFSSLFVLGPTIARDELGGATTWAAVLAALGAGSLLGDAISMRFRPPRPLLNSRLLVIGIVPALVLLAAAAPTAVLVPAFAAAGACFSIAGTLWFTLLQERVPDEALGRVSAFDTLASRALLPAGYAVVGITAQTLGAGATLIGAAVLLVIVQGMTVALPAVRELGRGDFERPGEPASP